MEGVPLFRESGKVVFQVTVLTGITGVDNGDLSLSELYDNNWVHMYHGCVSAVIRLTGEKGRVVLSATTKGIYATELVINVIWRKSRK